MRRSGKHLGVFVRDKDVFITVIDGYGDVVLQEDALIQDVKRVIDDVARQVSDKEVKNVTVYDPERKMFREVLIATMSKYTRARYFINGRHFATTGLWIPSTRALLIERMIDRLEKK